MAAGAAMRFTFIRCEARVHQLEKVRVVEQVAHECALARVAEARSCGAAHT